jgi:hypothetical protein
MRLRRRTLVIAAVAAATLVPASSAIAHDDHHAHRVHQLLQAPIAGSLTTDPTIFGVKPGGAPWVIDRGSARVLTNGRIDVRVEGLVIPTPPQNGTNPLPGIAATVFCGGTAVGTTQTVPFSPAGDARIDDRVPRLPTPCLAPAVLLNPQIGSALARGVYIAATGE